ncbi:MAG: SDR family oxidoreductase [Thermomicrobiales bacterium]|nr:SDR family oxidoreductase [Thermomicrobiales bacterium]
MSGPRLSGRTAVITGGGSGFGRATAIRFVEEGATKIVLADIRQDSADAVKAEVEALGAQALALQTDIGKIEACEQLVADTLAFVDGKIDIVVSNAAPFHGPEKFLEFRDETWFRDINVNLTGSYVIGQRFARAMAKTGGGSILYTTSINSNGAGAEFASYVATKAGIAGLIKVMAVELAKYNIRVNGVGPGPADTPRSVQLVGEETMEQFRKKFSVVPLGRLASAMDIANAFLYLASDEASYVTGQNLMVCGGITSYVYNVPED